ncbi:MAG: antibiotic biosynthesis monooxygenase [Rhodocyclaceae bacterium]|nr:antibiotic biosynthesis monooxygenase [Rhodocyclaceae bacterium]
MIVEYIRYSLGTHTPGELMEAYAAAGAFLSAAPECLGFELTQCAEDAQAFVLRIEWTSADGHLLGFRKGPHFPPFLAAIRAFVPEISEMRHYHVIPSVAWTRAPHGGGSG